MMRKERQLLFGFQQSSRHFTQRQALHLEWDLICQLLKTVWADLHHFISRKLNLLVLPISHPIPLTSAGISDCGQEPTAGGKSSLSFPTTSLMQSPHKKGMVLEPKFSLFKCCLPKVLPLGDMEVSGSHKQSLVKHHSQSLKNQTQQLHWEKLQLQAAAVTSDLLKAVWPFGCSSLFTVLT